MCLDGWILAVVISQTSCLNERNFAMKMGLASFEHLEKIQLLRVILEMILGSCSQVL